MAGHSKWANIRHRKGAQDKKRAKIFTKLIKEITISSRLGGGDISSNPRLRKAVSNAKANNLPADKIKRAIKKGTGELEGVIYEEVTYEGYGPSGVAILIDIITDNKNRTVAEIRHLLSQFDGNLGENGSVAWMFDKTGQIIMESKSANEDTVFEDVINAGAEDFYVDNNIYLVSTSADQLMEIRDKLDDAGYDIKSAEIELVPKTNQTLDDLEAKKVLKLLDALDDNDDVNKVYTNFDFA